MQKSGVAVLVGIMLGVIPTEGRGQRPAIVFSDTVVLAPARLAITGFAGVGVLVEVVGSDPHQATFLTDSVGRAWKTRTFEALAAASEGDASGRAPWSGELDPFAGGRLQGLLLGYVEAEGRRGVAELALTMYRRVFDASTTVPVTPAEAQRVLGRLGAALDATARVAGTDDGCREVPGLRQPALMPDIETRRKHPNGELVMWFAIRPDGRADPSSIEVLYASDRAFETSTRRFIERTTFEPARGPKGPCRMSVVQPFEFNVVPPAQSESAKRTRVARSP